MSTGLIVCISIISWGLIGYLSLRAICILDKDKADINDAIIASVLGIVLLIVLIATVTKGKGQKIMFDYTEDKKDKLK